jgi:hypothetical protein
VNFFQRYRYVLLAMAVLLVASVLIVKRLNTAPSRHVELREAFILLHTRGYTNQAQRLYEHLLRDLENISNRELMDDFQRTLLVVDPATHQPENLIWKYHWTVSNELERRSESTLRRALEMADEAKQKR